MCKSKLQEYFHELVQYAFVRHKNQKGLHTNELRVQLDWQPMQGKLIFQRYFDDRSWSCRLGVMTQARVCSQISY